MVTLLLVAGVAWAGAPELVVVGVHAPGLTGDRAEEAALRLAEGLDATGKVDALTPDEVRARIAGRESLILDSFALGPGRDALREGKVLYDRAQPDQAIPVLEQAARQLAGGLAATADVRDLHDALTLLGLAHAGLGNEDAARAAFRRSVTLDPTRQLDPVNYPPQIVALYSQVREAAAAEPPAVLNVTAPAGADVWVDGRPAAGGAASLELVPGEHHVLIRGEGGASWFDTVTLGPSERKQLSPSLQARALARTATDGAGRSRQTRDLYRSVGQYTDRDPVLLAGVTGNGQVALQIYAPASGNFSRALTAEADGDPVAALVDLLPAAVGFLSENGDIKSDRVSPQVVALDVSANDVLSGMILAPRAATASAAPAPVAKKGAPWYVWAGIGAVVAGGGATAAVLLSQEPEETGDAGTITFGPVP